MIIELSLYELEKMKLAPQDKVSKAPNKEIPWLNGPGIITLSSFDKENSILLISKLFTQEECVREKILGKSVDPEVKLFKNTFDELDLSYSLIFL